MHNWFSILAFLSIAMHKCTYRRERVHVHGKHTINEIMDSLLVQNTCTHILEMNRIAWNANQQQQKSKDNTFIIDIAVTNREKKSGILWVALMCIEHLFENWRQQCGRNKRKKQLSARPPALSRTHLFRAFKNCCYYLLPRQRHFTLKLIFLLTNFYRLNINGTFKNRYLYQKLWNISLTWYCFFAPWKHVENSEWLVPAKTVQNEYVHKYHHCEYRIYV